jgi:hypothetical protein
MERKRRDYVLDFGTLRGASLRMRKRLPPHRSLLIANYSILFHVKQFRQFGPRGDTPMVPLMQIHFRQGCSRGRVIGRALGLAGRRRLVIARWTHLCASTNGLRPSRLFPLNQFAAAGWLRSHRVDRFSKCLTDDASACYKNTGEISVRQGGTVLAEESGKSSDGSGLSLPEFVKPASKKQLLGFGFPGDGGVPMILRRVFERGVSACALWGAAAVLLALANLLPGVAGERPMDASFGESADHEPDCLPGAATSNRPSHCLPAGGEVSRCISIFSTQSRQQAADRRLRRRSCRNEACVGFAFDVRKRDGES